MKKLFLPLLTLFLLVSCTEQQKSTVFTNADPSTVNVSSERLARIDNLINQYIDSSWIAGAAGFIARDGKIIYYKAFGSTDAEKTRALDKNDIFRIASQTKAITSVAVMTLFEQGKFLLDDPVSKYIPEFANPRVIDEYNEKDSTFTTKPATREVTVRDLLTHTSGIEYAGIGSPMMKAIYAKNGIPGSFGSAGITIGEKMRAIGRLPLLHNPGEKYTYGMNVDVLGYLVEVWSGEKLDEYFLNHIFRPLGMSDTYFYIPGSKSSRLVKVISEDPDHKLIDDRSGFGDYPLLTDGTYFSGGAGLSSTIKDYAIFLQMMLNGGEYNGERILAPRTVELMTTNQIGDLSFRNDKFGLGFGIVTADQQLKLGVSEGTFYWGGYFGTNYWADPQKKIVGLLFINQSPFSHGEFYSKFQALTYQSIMD